MHGVMSPLGIILAEQTGDCEGGNLTDNPKADIGGCENCEKYSRSNSISIAYPPEISCNAFRQKQPIRGNAG